MTSTPKAPHELPPDAAPNPAYDGTQNGLQYPFAEAAVRDVETSSGDGGSSVTADPAEDD